MTSLAKISTVGTETVQHQRRVAESVNNILDFSYDDYRKQTPFEKENGVTPINPAFPPFHLHRYGATGKPEDDALTAWNIARPLGKIILGGPEFTYYTPAGFSITEDNLHVIGNNSTLKQSSTNASGYEAPLTVDGADGVQLDDLVLDLNNVGSSNTDAKGLAANDATNLTTRRLSFLNGGQMNIYATGLVQNHHHYYPVATTIGYGILVNEPDASSYGLHVYGHYFDLQGTNQSDGIEVNAPTNGFRLVRVYGGMVKRAYGNASNAGIAYGFSTVTDIELHGCGAEDCSNDAYHFEDGCEDFKVFGGNAFGCTHTSGASGVVSILGDCRRGEFHGVNTGNSDAKTQLSPPVTLYSPNAGEFNDDIKFFGGTYADGQTDNFSIDSARRLKIIGVESLNPNVSNGTARHFAIRKLGSNVNSGILIEGCTTADGANSAQSVDAPDGTSVEGLNLVDCDFSQAGTKLYGLGSSDIINAARITYSRAIGRYGTIAPAGAATTTVVTNANADRISGIRIFALNAAAQTLGNAWVSAITRGTSFTITHAAAAGTESYGYEIT